MTDNSGTVTCLRGKDAHGRPHEWRLRVGPVVHSGSMLTTATAELQDGRRAVLRSLPAASSIAPDESQIWLDNEIRALSRITTRYQSAGGPAELPRLIGRQFDSSEPYALLSAYPAESTAGAASKLLDSQRTAFAVSLFRSLAHLAAIGVVHCGVDMGALRLTGSTVQLVNFEHAVLVGEPSPVTSWRPAHPGDDVLAAGRLLHEVYTGTALTADEVPDGSAVPRLRTLLAGVFAEHPHERPSAVDLLRNLNSGALTAAADPDIALTRGRARFDAARRAKYHDRQSPVRNGAVPSPPETAQAWTGPPRPRWLGRTRSER